MRSKQFLDELKNSLQHYKQLIEAVDMGLDTSGEAIAQRREAVLDKHTGYAFFVQTYFPHYLRSKHTSELHRYLFEHLPQMVNDEKSVVSAIAAPRGEAKSTLVTQLFTLWCIVTHQKHFAVLIMDSIDQAYPMLEAIKAEIEFNPRIKLDFPEVTGEGKVWQMGAIVTANNVKVQVAGSGKKLRGLRHGARRPDLIILDDIENDEQVRSPEQRDKLENWLKKTVLPLGAAGEKSDVVYIGTVLHYDSVLSRVLNNPAWQKARFKSLIRMPENLSLWDRWEEILLNDGEKAADAYYQSMKDEMDKGAKVSWLARPLVDLMKIRARDGHAAFDSEYQNDPVSQETSLFANVISHCFYKDLPHHLIYFGAIDPSLGKNGASRDPSAILVGGFDRQNGVLYVIEALIKKRLPDLIIEDVIALQRRYQCQLWSVETVQFQEFLKTEIMRRSVERGIPVPCRGVKPISDKTLRIESLQPYFADGRIKLLPTHTALIDQLRHFPAADHDDGPDALHMLWSLATTNASGGSIKSFSLPEPSFDF